MGKTIYLSEKEIDGFCNAVETRANEMIIMIRECPNIKNSLNRYYLRR